MGGGGGGGGRSVPCVGSLAALEVHALPGVLTSLLGGLRRLWGATDTVPRWGHFVVPVVCVGDWCACRACRRPGARGACVAAVARPSAGDAKAPQASTCRAVWSLAVGGHGQARAPTPVAGRVLMPGMCPESAASL